MDETEKYKQRLEAIAEKRRLQEEQDRARRDMEDEKLRLQQLKRKSLRDQWLMEGAPLSPASPDAQSPRSPLWGSQAQEMEKHSDKLESKSQRLAEEEEKLKEQREDGQTEAVKAAAEIEAEMVQDGVVQNGENNTTASETTEDEVQMNQSALLDETAAVLTNGGEHLETDTNHDSQSTTNGLVVASDGVINMKLEPGLSLAESGDVPNANINEEEEEEEDEGTVVMRAERVIVTDEGDNVPEDLTPREDRQETVQSEETPLSNTEAGQEGGQAVEEVVKTEAAPETFTQPEKSEATEPSGEAQPATGDGDMQGGVDTNRAVETKSEGQDKESEDPTQTVQVPPVDDLGGPAVASVPVYSEAQPSTLIPELEAEDEAAVSSEGAEAALKAQDPAMLPGQFQEVPLANPQENQRTEAGPGEQEPLLSQAKAPDTQAEPAAATSTETHSLTRASQGEETAAPKHKACTCCSVM